MSDTALLLLIAYFSFGLLNGVFLGLTPDNERLNGLAQIVFFWSPFAVCMIMVRRSKIKKQKLLFALAALPTIWFAALPTIFSGSLDMVTRGYNPSVKQVSQRKDGNWNICQYHFSPVFYGEDAEYTTREKQICPGLKMVHKTANP